MNFCSSIMPCTDKVPVYLLTCIHTVTEIKGKVGRNRGGESSSTILGLLKRVVIRVDDVVGEWMKSDKCYM
jgi:hypothetical protein